MSKKCQNDRSKVVRKKKKERKKEEIGFIDKEEEEEEEDDDDEEEEEDEDYNKNKTYAIRLLQLFRNKVAYNFTTKLARIIFYNWFINRKHIIRQNNDFM